MAPSCSTELSTAEQRQLLGIARQAVQSDMAGRQMPAPQALGRRLRARRGAFVTLTHRAALRGCIGSLHGDQPLHLAVAEAARSAASRDPRFPPLNEAELAAIRFEIAVLSPLQPLPAATRAALLASLRPGVDRLLLEDRGRRATFLPKVWEQLPDPERFVEQLLVKAGLPPLHWSGTLRLQRYQAQSFGED